MYDENVLYHLAKAYEESSNEVLCRQILVAIRTWTRQEEIRRDNRRDRNMARAREQLDRMAATTIRERVAPLDEPEG